MSVDLYELTMAQSYLDHGMDGPATFSLFARHLPPDRGYLVVAGLEDVLAYLAGLAFSADDLGYLESTGLFTAQLLDLLAGLRFSGSVRAMPEGTMCFANEPLLEIAAPIIEAQIVETMVLNEVQLQTMIASKAARCVVAAENRRLVDFALRRTHGEAAGLRAARASYLAGFSATSNVLAGKRYGIPVAGTMAHSYIQSFPHEIDAFRAYASSYPDAAVLLLDTYDTLEGARRAAQVGIEMREQGRRLRGVRLDSGDLALLSAQVRRLLDEAGLVDTIVFVSGNLDEYTIERAVRAGAPIDGFGVGTRMGVSADAPYLEVAYKLVEYDGRPTLKLSADKASMPGPKQVWRVEEAGQPREDYLGLAAEAGAPEGRPLLLEVMVGGRRVRADTLEQARARCAAGLAAVPRGCLRLREPDSYPVSVTPALLDLERESRALHQAAEKAMTGLRTEVDQHGC